MLMLVDLPPEPFNSLVRKGTAGETLQRILGEIKPEAVYFTTTDKGHRGAVIVVDVSDPSRVPSIAEPLFLQFQAGIEFRVAMTPEDLGKSGLDEIGETWG